MNNINQFKITTIDKNALQNEQFLLMVMQICLTKQIQIKQIPFKKNKR